jgi:uroporphyrinogen decarboxylase
MCYLFYDDEALILKIFNKVGSLLLDYYKAVIDKEHVGAIIYNDDWGFKNSTLISPDALRKYIFPWVKQIVDLAHLRNKPIMLHSCGNLESIMEDIFALGFDAKHSYEDNILPVEEAYKKWSDRIAVIGGIDVDFMCRSTPEEISIRCRNMLKLSEKCGGYALGTGNSVPNYLPYDNYLAMVTAVTI